MAALQVELLIDRDHLDAESADSADITCEILPVVEQRVAARRAPGTCRRGG